MSDQAEPLPRIAEVTLRWPEKTELPIAQLANIFGVQPLGTEGVVLVVGQAVPPLLSGSREEQAASIKAAGYAVEATVLARFSLSAQKTQELANILLQALATLNAGQETHS